MALHKDVFVAGMGWLVLGLTTYVIYRRSKALSLTESIESGRLTIVVWHLTDESAAT